MYFKLQKLEGESGACFQMQLQIPGASVLLVPSFDMFVSQIEHTHKSKTKRVATFENVGVGVLNTRTVCVGVFVFKYSQSYLGGSKEPRGFWKEEREKERGGKH